MNYREILNGVIPVIPIPFLPNGDIDEPGITNITDHAIKLGASGIAFGFGSEIFRLTHVEYEKAIELTVLSVRSRIPVIAACNGQSCVEVQNKISLAKSLGATFALVNPPSIVDLSKKQILEFFRRSSENGIPLIIQDAPQWSGVELNDQLLVELSLLPNIAGFKVESQPTWVKIKKLRSSISEYKSILGGYGGLYLFMELCAGLDGTMPSAAHPNLFVNIIREFNQGNVSQAVEEYKRILPYLTLSSTSLDEYIWLQKELLKRMGVIKNSDLRFPAQQPDEFTCNMVLSMAKEILNI